MIETEGTDVLPPGWSYYHARRDFITPWGPRYVAGQTIKLTSQQAEALLERGVLEEGPDVVPIELGRREQNEKTSHPGEGRDNRKEK